MQNGQSVRAAVGAILFIVGLWLCAVITMAIVSLCTVVAMIIAYIAPKKFSRT